MKAIVNVKKSNQYSKFNFKTFEVVEVLSNLIALNLNGVTTDFSHKEVIIVDIENEMQIAYDNYNWGTNIYVFHNLRSYCDKNKIDVKLEYKCPA